MNATLLKRLKQRLRPRLVHTVRTEEVDEDPALALERAEIVFAGRTRAVQFAGGKLAQILR